jgi:N-acetylglucosamine-6-phosphate deacetylase
VLARFGTTSYYPTTVTAPTESIRRAVEFLAEYIGETEKGPTGGAQPLGIHMEGPYISVKRRGVHPPPYIVEPTLEAYQEFAKAAGGRLRIMTIAPELAGAPDVIREMLSSGVQPSIGHTDSTFAEADKAVEMGARQATHMFNAMRPFGHRDPGVIGKVLTDPRVKAELIADGVHVDVKAMELLYRCKGKDGIVLISDGISAVGMPDGNYQVGGLNVDVAGGVCRYEGALAGSVLTLDRAVRNMHTLVGVPLDEVIRMATLNTAQLMGLEGRKGSLSPGADADIVVMDDSFQIQQVYVRGIATN